MKKHGAPYTWLLALFIFALALQGCNSSEKKALEATAQAEDALVANATLEVGQPQISPNDGMEMVPIQAGEFLMGSKLENGRAIEWEVPYRVVSLDAYWIDRTEVTNMMFTKFVEETGYVTDAEKDGWGYVWTREGDEDMKRIEMVDAFWKHPLGPDSNIDGLENHPVIQVSWNDAAAYCQWAGRRLPTEAEWEKAARGIDGRYYPWGNEWDSSMANADDETILDDTVVKCTAAGCDGYDRTAPVDAFEKGASPYGVLGMAGNVLEWTADYFDTEYYATAPNNNPQGPDQGDTHVIRGACWFNTQYDLRTSRRAGNKPETHSDKLGFRCAVTDL